MQKDPKPSVLRRLTINLPESLLVLVDEAIFNLRKNGQRTSFSGMVEVALREVLRTDNLGVVVKRYGVSARRNLSGEKLAGGEGKAKR